MQEMTATLQTLIQQREIIKQAVYEITGMSDIIRGNSDPRETAAAQQLKGNYASLRLQDRQREVQRFARDIIELVGEIIAEHYQPETIRLISGYDQLTDDDEQIFNEAIGLLKNDGLRRFRIDIETDSTNYIDNDLEKRRATEFIGAFTQFLTASQSLGQNPAMIPLLGELLLYGVRQFKAGRALEGVIEDTVEKIVAQSQQPPPPPQPDPEMVMKQQEHELEMQKLQVQIQKIMADIESVKVRAEAEVAKDVSQAMANQAPIPLNGGIV
jgi:hypothetical protein